MKRQIFILLLISLFILSCTTQNKQGEDGNTIDLTGYTKRTVKLLNNVGTLNIYLPNELDSLNSYVHYTDYKCGARQIFEFSNPKYTVVHLAGWISHQKIDSTCYFICQQIFYPECIPKKRPQIDSTSLKEDRNYLFEIYGHPIPFRGELLKINNRDFALWEYWYKGRFNLNDTTIPTCEVHAETIVGGTWLTLYFECTKKDTVGFMNKAIISLKTIDIDTAK